MRTLFSIFRRCEHQWKMTEYSVIRKRAGLNGHNEAVGIADFRQCTLCGAIQPFVF